MIIISLISALLSFRMMGFATARGETVGGVVDVLLDVEEFVDLAVGVAKELGIGKVLIVETAKALTVDIAKALGAGKEVDEGVGASATCAAATVCATAERDVMTPAA